MVLQQIKRCTDCGSTDLIINRDRGEVTCRSCGLIIEDKMIEFGQEWREGAEEESGRRRAGAPITYTQFDQGLGTEVGETKDLIFLSPKARTKFFRLRKWQYRISTALERNLKNALIELKRISSHLKLPKKIDEDAAMIYTQTVQRSLARGRNIEAVVAGAIYAACRRHEVPRTLEEISQATNVDKREIGRTFRYVVRELGLSILPTNPIDYINRFATSLNLKPETQSEAIEILKKAQHRELTSGRGPTGIAAAALYIASLLHGEKRTQREVAEVAGVTEVTIRNRYKELVEKLSDDKRIKKLAELFES